MSYSFNLTDEKWIPCITIDGGFLEFSLREILAQAHEIREISCETPIQSAAILPLLLAILHRNFGPADTREWGELWNARKFHMQTLVSYFKEWYDRFDLFHPERPFYQVADDRVKAATIHSHLAQTMQNHSVHFSHQTAINVLPLSPPEATKILLQAQAFRLGGGVSGKQTPNHVDSPLSRGALFFARGDNLFQTLMLNLVRYPDDSVLPTRSDDKPVWERDDPREGRTMGKNILHLSPAGYLDFLTWQTNHVQLLPYETAAGIMVREVTIAPVARFHDSVFCPLHNYLRRTRKGKDDEHIIHRFNRQRALWRDYHTLLPQDSNDKTPAVIRWCARLAQYGQLDENQPLRLMATGNGTEPGQAKTIFYRREIVPLPFHILRDKEKMNDISSAILVAEDVATILSTALHLLADRVMNKTLGESYPNNDKNSRDIRQKLMSQWNAAEAKRYSPQLYWTKLEREFEIFVKGLRDVGDEPIKTWNKTLVKVAEESLNDAVRLAGYSPWALKGKVEAENHLYGGIKKLFEKKGIEVND